MLASRAAHLVHGGFAKPYQILALTFTNKAAAELKSRVEDMVDIEGNYIAAGTFHSLFARLMRQAGQNIGLDPNFTIIDTDDRRRLIKAIIKEKSIVGDYAKPNLMDWRISKAKNDLISPEQMAKQATQPFDRSAAIVYEVYQRRLRKMNGMDFDDLLLRPLEAFEEYPGWLEMLQNRFKYVMVDEYQDTNRVQYLLVKNIAAAHGNLAVVGDDDQAIYGWRGATVRNILDFQRDWKNAKVVRLEQNYRSTKPILEAAWAVIHNNKVRHPKKLWTEREKGEPIELINAPDDEAESLRFVGIVDEIHKTDSIPYNNFAILYRTNAQSLPFERSFRAAQIPYQIVGGVRFYERKEIKDVLAYLRVIVNSADDVSLMRVINYPPRGIGMTVLGEIQASARMKDTSFSEAIVETLQSGQITSRSRKALEGFVDLIASLGKFSEENPFPVLADEIIRCTNLEVRYEEEERGDTKRAESKIGNIRNLLADIHRFAAEHPESSLNDFLEEVALVTDVDRYDPDKDAVKLMTLHTAKGLEFPVVFIGGLEEGLLPLMHQDKDDSDIEEERRLFYVGVTRAKDRLFLGYAVNRLRWGNVMWNGPSRFLREIPPELFREAPFGKKAKTPAKASKNIARSSVKSALEESDGIGAGVELNPDELQKGLLVKHRKFDLGVIVSFQKMGIDSRVIVDFDEVGKKTLILRYARLEKA